MGMKIVDTLDELIGLNECVRRMNDARMREIELRISEQRVVRNISI